MMSYLPADRNRLIAITAQTTPASARRVVDSDTGSLYNSLRVQSETASSHNLNARAHGERGTIRVSDRKAAAIDTWSKRVVRRL
jgi:hypothetical protein